MYIILVSTHKALFETRVSWFESLLSSNTKTDRGGSRNFCQGGPVKMFFSHLNVFYRGSYESPREVIGPIASRRGSVPVFL